MNDILRFLSLLVYIYVIAIIFFRIFIYVYFNYIYSKEEEDLRGALSLSFAEKNGLNFEKAVPLDIENLEFNDKDITDKFLRFPLYRPISSLKCVNYISGSINNTKFISNERTIFAPKTLWFQQIFIIKNNKFKVPSFYLRYKLPIIDDIFYKDLLISYSEDKAFSKKFTVFNNPSNNLETKNTSQIKNILNSELRQLLVLAKSFYSIYITGTQEGDLKIVITQLNPENNIDSIFEIIKSIYNQQF